VIVLKSAQLLAGTGRHWQYCKSLATFTSADIVFLTLELSLHLLVFSLLSTSGDIGMHDFVDEIAISISSCSTKRMIPFSSFFLRQDLNRWAFCLKSLVLFVLLLLWETIPELP
jgi:hypothetical protein